MPFQSNLSARIRRQILTMSRQQRVKLRGNIALVELEVENESGQESLGVFARDFAEDFGTTCAIDPFRPRRLAGTRRGCSRTGWRCAFGHRSRITTAACQYRARADHNQQQNLSSHSKNPFIDI